MNTEKYRGIIPAFYACYDTAGHLSPTAIRALARYLKNKGVTGLYVGGSSGECIYQSVSERKTVLENVMEEVGDEMTVIAHVACNNTDDSKVLATHAESLGVDAIAAIPPIYFKLPEHAIADYWNAISNAAPRTDFIIYNIPQLAGVALTPSLLAEMKKNPKVIGVKNSSMPIYDIITFMNQDVIVFNGPDEQLASGLLAGAIGGIGGTYAVMPELYLQIERLVRNGNTTSAGELQAVCCHIIDTMNATQCSLYAMMKEVLRRRGGPDCGGVRPPLTNISKPESAIAAHCANLIENTITVYTEKVV